MKKFKRGKYLFGSLLVFAFVTTLLLNLKQENEIGDINNYTPIALLEDAIVYNYINDDDALVIGYYDIASKKQSDVICENGFYISSGLPAVIDNSVILPVTLNTNEHKLMKINADSNTSEMIFNEFNSYPIDSVATMNTGIYMLSSKKDNSTATSYIRKYNENTNEMDICIEKEFTDNTGEQIKAFARSCKVSNNVPSKSKTTVVFFITCPPIVQTSLRSQQALPYYERSHLYLKCGL